MKKPLLIITFLFFTCLVKAQSTDTLKQIKTDTTKFLPIVVAPEYPGGLAKLFQYINSHIKYHGDAQGRVMVTFVVEKDGSLSDIKILKGIDAETDAACLKVMQNCPAKWKPGLTPNNMPARVQYTIPISFG